MLYLGEYPWSAAGGSAYHHKVTACVIVHMLTAFAAVDISVSYYRYTQRLFYLCNYIKVSLSAVHLP